MIIEEITDQNYKEKNNEDAKLVEDKIKLLERQINNKDINWYIFLDPTIWAYKFLKDKQGNPLKLRPFQNKIINDRHQFIVIVAANQIGKTVTMEIKAIHHAIHVPNASVLIISASEDQSIRVLDEIKQLLRTANIDFKSVIGEVENRTELHINNLNNQGVSIIRCLPPTKAVRGYYATLIVCDEIGFWEIDGQGQTEYFNKVIASRILDTKNWKNEHFTMGQICCISNPNAQQGALWSLWNDADYNQYRYSYLASPLNTIEEYEKAQGKLPTDEFDSVYAATFSSASGGFITEAEYADAEREYQIQPNQTRFLGGDFAGEDTKTRDVGETVLFGSTHTKEKIEGTNVTKVKVDYYKVFPLRTKKANVYEEVKKFPNLSKFAYDKIGVGDSVKADLKDRGILPEYKIESLTYSLPNKSEVYYNMKHLFEQRLVIIPKGLNKLKEQLLGLRFEKTEGGHIKVHHAREGLHDDWADALANSLFAAKRLIGVTPSITALKPQKTLEETKPGRMYTLVCPECEKTNYNESNGYYTGFNPHGKSFERKSCPMHTTI